MDLTSYLLGKNSSSGGGGGGGTTPTTLDELNQVIRDFFTNIPNTYTTKTTESVTLYTPSADYKGYCVYKRSNGKYRAVWIENGDGFYVYSNSQLYGVVIQLYPNNLDNATITFSQHNFNAYYSTDYNTKDEAIEALKSPSTSYTYLTNNFFGMTNDDEYVLPYSNKVNVQYLNGEASLISSQKISSNETIQVIS